MRFKPVDWDKLEEAAEKADADRYQSMRDGDFCGSLGSPYGNRSRSDDMKKFNLRTEHEEDSL